MSINKESCDENVLILQGGGSLGAYECGVYKAIERLNIKCDVVAGTSIGAINATIIAANKSGQAARELENFWLNLSESFTIPFFSQKMREMSSSMFAALWGNPNAFYPLWLKTLPGFLYNSPYLYDISPLKKTLEKYVDYTKLKGHSRPRLIVTSTDVQNGKPSIFDSKYDEFNSDYVLASAGYPFYGISWTKVGSRFLWDGTLLSNTPLREVIAASPTCDKRVIIANLFPHMQKELPQNMFESWHRARDIMHIDKTDEAVRMSKIISRYLGMMKKMHDIIKFTKLDDEGKQIFKEIEVEYKNITSERGAIIKEIVKVERKEQSHYLFEDADFSSLTIKNLIDTGEKDALEVLNSFAN